MSASRKHLGAGDPFRRAGPPWEASELLCPREWSVLEALPWVGGWHGGAALVGRRAGGEQVSPSEEVLPRQPANRSPPTLGHSGGSGLASSTAARSPE